MEKPLVSIITPTYNSERFITKTIESILDQTYTNWELLVTDDSSQDKTVEIIKNYQKKDKRIKLFLFSKNFGTGAARNNSIENASGRFIAFCDSDDQWKPEKLEKQIDFMLRQNISFSFTGYEVISENNLLIKEVRAKEKVNYYHMLKKNYIGCLTVVYDTEKIKKNYMPLIRKRQDWALWLILLRKVDYAISIDEPLAIYRKRKGSISSSKIEMFMFNFRIYKTIAGFSILQSLFYSIRYIFYYKFK